MECKTEARRRSNICWQKSRKISATLSRELKKEGRDSEVVRWDRARSTEEEQKKIHT